MGVLFVFGPKTESRRKKTNAQFRFGTAMAGKAAEKTPRVTLGAYFGRPTGLHARFA